MKLYSHQRGADPRRRAAAVAELAVVIPFLLLMLFVAVDYCRVFACAAVLHNCAHIAALYASQTVSETPDTELEDAAKQAAVREGTSLKPPLKKEQVTIQIDTATVTVTVQYDMHFIIEQIGIHQKSTITDNVTLPRAPETQE